jgi:hypothetical protein
MKKLLIITLLFLSILTIDVKAQSEELRVSAAILNYVEALYEAKPELIAESVHPDLHKYGYYKAKDATTYQGSSMTFKQLQELAGKWNAKKWLSEDAPKEIKIFEIQDQTATAKLTAYWGTDYFHLAKIDGKWMIMNVLWQSPPQVQKTASNEGD